jgi:peptidoglycan hydrolase-like protein with peptidoglycan-binding domain
LGDNSPSQLDGIYGENTRAGVEWLQSTFTTPSEVHGHRGVTFTCRTLTRALELIHRAERNEIKVEYANPQVAVFIAGGTSHESGRQVHGLLEFSYLITGRNAFPDHRTPNAVSPIAASLQEALYRLGYFREASGEITSRSFAVDGNWGKRSAAASKQFEQKHFVAGDPPPDGIVGAATARRLYAEVLQSLIQPLNVETNGKAPLHLDFN